MRFEIRRESDDWAAGEEPSENFSAENSQGARPAFPLDGDLPDDLAALAEQLSDDAARLADCFPADAAERWSATATAAGAAGAERTTSSSSSGRWLPYAAAVAVVLTGGAVGKWLWSPAGPQAPDVATPRAATPPGSDVGATELAGPVSATQDDSAPAVAAPSKARLGIIGSPRTEVVPAGLFQTLTGAEQEAMLDLMEQQGLEETSQSI